VLGQRCQNCAQISEGGCIRQCNLGEKGVRYFARLGGPMYADMDRTSDRCSGSKRVYSLFRSRCGGRRYAHQALGSQTGHFVVTFHWQ
jgi:hypothetical protein